MTAYQSKQPPAFPDIRIAHCTGVNIDKTRFGQRHTGSSDILELSFFLTRERLIYIIPECIARNKNNTSIRLQHTIIRRPRMQTNGPAAPVHDTFLAHHTPTGPLPDAGGVPFADISPSGPVSPDIHRFPGCPAFKGRIDEMIQEYKRLAIGPSYFPIELVDLSSISDPAERPADATSTAPYKCAIPRATSQ